MRRLVGLALVAALASGCAIPVEWAAPGEESWWARHRAWMRDHPYLEELAKQPVGPVIVPIRK